MDLINRFYTNEIVLYSLYFSATSFFHILTCLGHVPKYFNLFIDRDKFLLSIFIIIKQYEFIWG